MKSATSILMAVAIGLFASGGANAATVGSFTFNAGGDEFSIDNDVVGVSPFPHDYDFTINLSGPYRAILTFVDGSFTSLTEQWLGLSGPESGPLSAMTSPAILIPTLSAGTHQTLRIDGAGTGTYHIQVTAVAPIPAAALLMLSGLAVIGFAGTLWRRPKSDRKVQA